MIPYAVAAGVVGLAAFLAGLDLWCWAVRRHTRKGG